MTEPEAFFRLYEGLPRQGPGSDACTLEALRRLPALPAQPRILDLGCGAGRQTLVLADALGARVVAVDLHRPFLDQLEAAARERGLADRVETRCADMGALELPPGSVDLLWSEGAIYLLGFEDGLRRFRPWLAPGGLAAVTECSWLGAARPDEAAAFWRAAYPAIGDVADNCARAARAGYEVLDWFALPPSAWWDDYYTPLRQRMRELMSGAEPALAAIIAETEREIDLYERCHEAYGYVFYLMRRA
ncbi:MAG TPA: methyltransferase domain-containing protein [Geminicoccaceae bacterium]|nr:methyltransferase domain-containing protein [Geminicoccaceae bacterium]